MNSYRTLTACCLLLGTCTGALAQAPRSGGGGEQQKFLQQYQQIAAEKTALQAQVTQLQTDLGAAKKDLESVKKDRDALKVKSSAGPSSSAEVAKLNAAKSTVEHNLEQYKLRMNELVDKFRVVAQTLKDTDADRTKVRNELAQRNADFDKCAESNLQLYEISNEVLDRYDHVGLFTKASASEPFTKITRVRIENLVDDYRERAQSLRVSKRKP